MATGGIKQLYQYTEATEIVNKSSNVCLNLLQRDFAGAESTVSRRVDDKRHVHMHRQRNLFLQLPHISKEQSESEQLVCVCLFVSSD